VGLRAVGFVGDGCTERHNPFADALIGEEQNPASSRLMTPEFWALTAASSIYFAGSGILNALMPTFVVDELGGSEATAGTVMGVLAISALAMRRDCSGSASSNPER
jgi:hypothetical protein